MLDADGAASRCSLVVAFVWIPTIASVVLSFTSWDGIGGVATIEWVGTQQLPADLHDLPAVLAGRPPQHHLAGLPRRSCRRRSGCCSPYLLDKKIRGTRIYQSILFLPVVLSLALVGFIWQLIYAHDQGLINNILGTTEQGNLIDWLGNPDINLWAVLVAATWRHAGYIMVLYLAGLKSVDPSLREAAAIDGASEWQTFRRVVFPALRPINIVVARGDGDRVAAGVRHRLHHQQRHATGSSCCRCSSIDNIVGEASRIGFGSAIAVILLLIALGPIITFLVQHVPRSEA